MKTLIVGHRGSGKSTLLHRLESYAQNSRRMVSCFDLDKEISHGEGKSIDDIFKQHGEAHFRNLERQYIEKLSEKAKELAHPVFVAVGAGFEGPPPQGWRCLWLKRSTDPLGRIFFDRPRLDHLVQPLKEYLDRYPARTQRYREWAHEVITVDEGFDIENKAEEQLLMDEVTDVGGCLTLLPKHFKDREYLRNHISKRVHWDVDYIELRDDLLSLDELMFALQLVPVEKLLLSFRDRGRVESTRAILDNLLANNETVTWDWPSEWGLCEFGKPSVYSCHRRGESESVAAVLKRFSVTDSQGTLQKLAVPIHSFEELFETHKWWSEMSHARVFLPMSETARWDWYRLLHKNKMTLNFWKEDEGSAVDQPPLLRWMRSKDTPNDFAAVLGDPILHSRTPAEQFVFFSGRSQNVFAIQVDDKEFATALPILRELGLAQAAVTSPLKEAAFLACRETTPEAQQFKSVNTLLWQGSYWVGANTDVAGLVAAKTALPSGLDKVAVWGGGGTLPVLKKVFPEAVFYSARTGEAREGDGGEAPDILVWAIARRHAGEAAWPPLAWCPRVVLDLNYTEDSPGREYAMKTSASYISGLTMFRVQAQKQREFWSKTFEEPIPE